jgi:hypothetical protein
MALVHLSPFARRREKRAATDATRVSRTLRCRRTNHDPHRASGTEMKFV